MPAKPGRRLDHKAFLLHRVEHLRDAARVLRRFHFRQDVVGPHRVLCARQCVADFSV
jgi:hypothetical protein